MKRSGKERSQRQLRVSQSLKRVLVEFLHREFFSDPILQDPGRLTINDVQISPDFRHATAFISSLDINEDLENVVAALNKVAHQFTRYVARNLETKNTPKISFEVDQTSGFLDKINTLLD